MRQKRDKVRLTEEREDLPTSGEIEEKTDRQDSLTMKKTVLIPVCTVARAVYVVGIEFSNRFVKS